MFPLFGGKCLSFKSFHNWLHKCGKGFADDEKVETEMQKWLRQQSKRLIFCGFRRTGKAMGQVYQCWWRICREINVFCRFECHMSYVLYPFVTYLLTLPRIRILSPATEIYIAIFRRATCRFSTAGIFLFSIYHQVSGQ
jgi:hypothetical protein